MYAHLTFPDLNYLFEVSKISDFLIFNFVLLIIKISEDSEILLS